MESSIKTRVHVLPSSDPTLPPLVLHVIHLDDSFMLWAGSSSSGNPDDAEKAVLNGNLCRDWACAMPTRTNYALPPAATSLFRSSSSDVALSMARRLAKRFRKQIFLAIDLPLTLGQGEQLLYEAERGIVETLEKIVTS